MAVPFKAKDVAAEMTEFGHPDVAICFTHLSYYYSGLTDKQLIETLEILNRHPNPNDTYNNWLEKVPQDLKQDILSYSGINLSDPVQREEKLFPILRFNVYVVDFWLSHCVFPQEAKLFAKKMMCTAWDLCSENLKNVLTGFSGTNDTKLLLPLPIHQNDLLELEKTNERMRYTLLMEENNYQHLEPNISASAILKLLVEQEIPVLLDSGALMLELNNFEVAKNWLKMLPNDRFDAAVFFNDDDVLMVVDQNDNTTEFELSAYRDGLDRCVVYLDDTHTRGTDLKFPKGARACVTLSGGITRDKTVQACMRMRMLGKSHSVSFWASEEADNKIRYLRGKQKHEVITTLDVVEYITNNSNDSEKEGLVHWCTAGYNYIQKLSAHRVFENSDDSLNTLSERCLDREIIDLEELFGAKDTVLLMDIINRRFDGLVNLYSDHEDVVDTIASNSAEIVKRLNKHIPDMKKFTQLLDEEQEKELEHELEEERQICRPGKADPAKPVTNETLKELFVHGLVKTTERTFDKLIEEKSIVPLPFGFEKTTFWNIVQANAWGKNIFVTRDFIRVVNMHREEDKEDEFLRPVWWIVSINSSAKFHCGSQILIILSSFECNHFIPLFRSSNVKSTLHIFSPRTQVNKSLLANNVNLQLPLNKEIKIIDYFYLAQLNLFSGTVYFESKDEQDFYAWFLGIVAIESSDKYRNAFNRKEILSNGFILPAYRNLSSDLVKWCNFIENPDKLVVKIAEIRNGFLPDKSHVSLLVNESKKSFE